MARKTKPLTDTEIKATKPKDAVSCFPMINTAAIFKSIRLYFQKE
jgi:hypothetical protein